MNHKFLLMVNLCVVTACLASSASAQSKVPVNEPDWWLTPQRMIQTNLREIDATMDIDQYVKEVKEFGANVALFNMGGIVANYDTELENHWQNTFMEGDMVGEVLEKLHAEGIRMMARFDFSKLNEKYAMQHPEWLYVSEKGETVNYNGQVHTCIMGGYQQEYALRILEEAVTKYPVDGVFFNMIGFPQTDYSRVFHGICQCENCKKTFETYSGMKLPKSDGDPNVLRTYKQWQQIEISNQFEAVRKTIKGIRPTTAICTYTVNYIDVIRKESGHPMGDEPWNDVDRAQWTLLTTEDKQLTNATVHFYQMIFRHSASAPYLHARRLWQQMVNGAWLDFYCIGPLQRIEDRSSIPVLSGIFNFHKNNEKWLLETESAAQIGLVRKDNDDYWGWVQMLSESHIPYELVSMQHSDFPKYDAIIVPESGTISDKDAGKLDAYVARGGKLLLSGKIPDASESAGPSRTEKNLAPTPFDVCADHARRQGDAGCAGACRLGSVPAARRFP